MKKLILFYILCPVFFLATTANCQENSRRGLFVLAQEGPQILSSREEIIKLTDLAKKAKIEILFMQIYRGNQAWFPSKLADSTPYEACLKNVSEDPLQLLIKEAHRRGIKVYAWLNMLSLSNNKDARLLKKYGSDILTRNQEEKKALQDYKIDKQYFLEPGDPRVRRELCGIIEEILAAYPGLDGIQFDYVRYPDKNPAYGYTKTNTERFKEATGLKTIDEGNPAWQDWKRSQVTQTLKQLIDKARELRADIQISATGCMPYQRAYYEAFQDWPSWLNRRLVDSVTIMDYSPDHAEFERWISGIKDKVDDFKRVDIGIGAYKLTHSSEEFEKELRFCEVSGSGGCVIFHYASLLEGKGLSDILMSKDK